MLYIKLFTQPIKKLVNFMEQYQSGMTGFKRFIKIIEEDIEKEKDIAIDIKDVKGEIEFKNVNFSYEDNKILENVSLKIESGKMLALVGPSGGGKSTFCNLIPRFYDVDSGDIEIDGTSIYDLTLSSLRNNIGVVQQEVFLFTGTIKDNIRYGKQDATDEQIIDASIYDLTLSSLRNNIGVVQQEVFLFTGTIKDNIRYGKQDATDEQIIDAAKRANIHEYIMGLKDGYDTFIGERGVKLSGGQKQRISIARVFLKNPPILILDEATSALDNTTEYLIQKSLEELCRGRTTIVVAHRLSTIKNADEIIVLTENGIEERGSHTELIRKSGIYAELNRYAVVS